MGVANFDSEVDLHASYLENAILGIRRHQMFFRVAPSFLIQVRLSPEMKGQHAHGLLLNYPLAGCGKIETGYLIF